MASVSIEAVKFRIDQETKQLIENHGVNVEEALTQLYCSICQRPTACDCPLKACRPPVLRHPSR